MSTDTAQEVRPLTSSPPSQGQSSGGALWRAGYTPADTIGTKLEQIEIRVGELQGEEEAGKKVLASIAPAKIQSWFSQGSGTRYRCKLGQMILMMGTFGIFVPADGTEVHEKRLVYEGIQGLLENVAMGIEEKQAEMREKDKSLSAKRMELTELEKTIQRRQMLLDLTSKEIEEGMLRLEEEKKKIEERKIWEEEPANCTTMATEPEGLTTKEDGIPGLQIMGVFTLCGLLAALSCGGVTSILVATAKAWTTKPPQQRRR